MGVSKVSKSLYADVEKYSAILKPEQDRLIRRYKDPLMRMLFGRIGSRAISIGPMALCDAVLKDIGRTCPKKLLAGVGLTTFHISTHDDLIDEPPRESINKGALLYSGNIALFEGIKVLVDNGYAYAIDPFVEVIQENHYRQQKVIEMLWRKRRPTKSEYTNGIEHIASFMSIGPIIGIAYAKRMDLKDMVLSFGANYGYACQLTDDMTEIEDDLKSGYWSLPIIRAREMGMKGKINAKTKNMLISELKEMSSNYMDRAVQSIPRTWRNTNDIVNRLKEYVRGFSY